MLVVDDHVLVRTGVANIISHEPDLEVVAEAANGAEAVAAFERHRPDVTLLDLRMPVMEGVEAVRQIRRAIRRQGDRADDLRHGRGHHPRAQGRGEGIRAEGHHRQRARRLHSRRARRQDVSGAAAAAKLAEGVARVQLTPRELATLRLMADGRSNKEIAGTLGISERTVKTHLGHLFEKLGVTSRTEAVKVAARTGTGADGIGQQRLPARAARHEERAGVGPASAEKC